MLEILPARADQVRDFFGGTPKQTVRAWVAVLEGQLVGIAGFAYGGQYITVFSDLKPEIRPYKKTILKAGKMILREAAKRHGGAVIAIADPDEPTAPNFLRRLGFLHAGSSPEGEVYQWLN